MSLMVANRIASLLASSTEILYGLNLGSRVVAVSHECDFPADALSKARVTRTRVDAQASSLSIDQQVKAACASGQALYEIDVARLAQVQPDLIVTQAQCDVCAVRYADVVSAVASHPSLSHTKVVALNPMTLNDVFTDIARVAAAAGVPEEATVYVSRLRSRVEVVQAKTKHQQRPRVACIEWIDPPMLAGNWMPELIGLAGGQCNLAASGAHSTFADWNEVVVFDPEVIVVMPCGFDLKRTLAEAPALRAFPKWNRISAVRNGRVFAADGNAYFNRSGPRLVDSLEILAALLHPDLIAAPATEQAIKVGFERI